MEATTEADKASHIEGELMLATDTAIATLDPFETELAAFKERYEDVVYDLDDDVQNKQARSDKLSIGKVIARLDEQHKFVKSPLLTATRRLDDKRRNIKDDLLLVQGTIKSQLEAHEAKEKARIDRHFEGIQAIRGWAGDTEAATASALQDYLDGAMDEPLDIYEEFKEDAALARQETIETLEKLLAQRQQYEAEQAELKKLRDEATAREQADRDAKIAAEAADKARKEAQEAHQMAEEVAVAKRARERMEAEKAVQEAEEEVRAANLRAEQAAADERHRIKLEEDAEERVKAAAAHKEAKRKAHGAHVAKVEKDVRQALLKGGWVKTAPLATALVEAIKDGEIPYLQIVY